MAIKVGGTTVIDDSRNVSNIGTIKGLTYPSSDGTVGQFMKTDGAGALSFATVESDPTLATLTKSFASGETSSIALSSAITTAPVVSVIKEVPQTGVTSKGSWDVATDGANYERHDTAYDTTLTSGTIGFNTDLTEDTNKEYYANITNEQGVRFKDDGTVMYIADGSANNLREYSLSTAYVPSTATLTATIDNYVGTTNVSGLHFKPDGTELYLVTNTTPSTVHQYNLSTAWDVSATHQTAPDSTYVLGNSPGNAYNIQFNSDGTKMFTNASGANSIYQYSLSTAWDITTASFSKSFSYSSQSTAIIAFVFSPNGLKLFLGSDAATDVLYEYTLSTAFDVSTASYTGNTFTLGTGETSGLWFEDNGKIFYRVNRQTHRVEYYDVASTNALTLGSGSFAASDVGKTIEGNGGEVILTAADGSYSEIIAFTDSSTIASGDWSMTGTTFNATDGLELSNAVLNFRPEEASTIETELSVSAYETDVQGLYIKPDGTKVYITGKSSDDVHVWDLATPFDLSTWSYDNSFYVGTQEPSPTGLFFKPDGTKFYIIGEIGDDVNEYDLSTAWDVSSATFVAATSIATQNGNPLGIFFKPDGTKLYTCDEGNDNLHEYDLSTAWDTSTLSFVQTFNLGANGGVPTNPHGVYFTPDGLTFFAVSNDYKLVYRYTLSTAWDISTASSEGSAVDLTSTLGTAKEITFSPDGLKMYLADAGANKILQYNSGSLYSVAGSYEVAITNAGGQIDSSTWLDINTMTADEDAGDGTVSYAVSTDGRTTWSVIKDSDGVRPIVRDNSGTWQYNTAVDLQNNWDLSAAVYSNSFSISSQELAPEGIFFKPDGLKMYICGTTGDDVNEYDLSTAWDATTATFLQNFSVSAQTTNPVGLHFKPDGTKMFIMNQTNDRVLEYALSTAWDVSSASYTQLFSVNAQAPVPEDLFFKTDGTKMYILCSNGDNIEEYDLSTAWDISTATHLQGSSGLAEGTPHSLFIKPDGTKVYVTGQDQDEIDEFNLTTAWDISTLTFVQKLDTDTEDTAMTGVFFKPDGSVMYMLGATGDAVYTYNIGTSSYTTSATWEDATTNDEHYALQEALSSNQFNRMDKTQLDAVTDPNHYTLGDSLDLMIGLYQGTASADVPSSDGVAINYDAEVLNQGAVLGTDYDFDMPDSTTLRVTSNASQNLKIRVV